VSEDRRSETFAGDFTPHLERFGLCIAPNVGNLSRVWSVRASSLVSLATSFASLATPPQYSRAYLA